MFADALRALYAYNTWATGQVLAAAAHLTPEQLNVPGQAGHGSVRDTLLHLLEVHRGWLSWWDGSKSAEASYADRLDRDALPDVAAIQVVWAEISAQTGAFVSTLTDSDPGRVYGWDMGSGRTWAQPLWGMMLHVANHGTQHRAEVATMLTGFGHSPGDLDLIFYLARPLDAPDAQ